MVLLHAIVGSLFRNYWLAIPHMWLYSFAILKWQVRYYISYLRKKRIAVERGILDYPLLKKRKEILLNDEDEEKLKDILLDIEYISNQENAPATINKKWCKKCAFYEYCFS